MKQDIDCERGQTEVILELPNDDRVKEGKDSHPEQ